jgi:hypothetical protein
MKLWVDLEHMPAISRNNINFLKSQEPIGWTRTDIIKKQHFLKSQVPKIMGRMG